MDITSYMGGGSLLSAAAVRRQMLEGRPLTIAGVSPQEFDDRKKLVLEFEEIGEKLALNTTNTQILGGAYGMESDAWVGKKLTLFLTKVKFQGNLTDSVQVKAVA